MNHFSLLFIYFQTCFRAAKQAASLSTRAKVLIAAASVGALVVLGVVLGVVFGLQLNES